MLKNANKKRQHFYMLEKRLKRRKYISKQRKYISKQKRQHFYMLKNV